MLRLKFTLMILGTVFSRSLALFPYRRVSSIDHLQLGRLTGRGRHSMTSCFPLFSKGMTRWLKRGSFLRPKKAKAVSLHYREKLNG